MSSTERPNRERRGVRLSADEAWDVIGRSHTGVFTSLRRDGVPISLPVWFVALDRRVYMTTPNSSKKVLRIRHDARSSFLVESGEMWAELEAVHLTGRAVILHGDDALEERIRLAQDAKYAPFRAAPTVMRAATKQHYAQRSAFIQFEPDERIVSWNNARLFG